MICKVCEKEYEGHHKSRYCSDACRHEGYKESRRISKQKSYKRHMILSTKEERRLKANLQYRNKHREALDTKGLMMRYGHYE